MSGVIPAGSPACFDDYQQELVVYLAQRFGSIAFAERVSGEVRSRLEESDILSVVGNPRVYLSSFGLSLGLQFLQEEFAYKQLRTGHTAQAGVN